MPIYTKTVKDVLRTEDDHWSSYWAAVFQDSRRCHSKFCLSDLDAWICIFAWNGLASLISCIHFSCWFSSILGFKTKFRKNIVAQYYLQWGKIERRSSIGRIERYSPKTYPLNKPISGVHLAAKYVPWYVFMIVVLESMNQRKSAKKSKGW